MGLFRQDLRYIEMSDCYFVMKLHTLVGITRNPAGTEIAPH